MSTDLAAPRLRDALKTRTFRTDCAVLAGPRPLGVSWVYLAVAACALGFVVLGAERLDLGPLEARLGLAASESPGPMGQLLGDWAPDLWPAEVWPSLGIARLQPGGRPTTGAVRWPPALAGILAGWLLARGMYRALGARAAILMAFSWFGSLALIDRSSNLGLDLILGLGTLAAINRLLARSADWIAGIWVSVAFLAGGWPPLVLIGLAMIVIRRPASTISARLLLPPVATGIVWSAATIDLASSQLWGYAMALPIYKPPDPWLGAAAFAVGLPWSPFCLLAFSRRVRAAWPTDGGAWVTGWLQVALASGIAGSLVPGLGPPARTLVLTGLLVGAAACLATATARARHQRAELGLLLIFGGVFAVWLVLMIYGGVVWNFTQPFYRSIGIPLGVFTLLTAACGLCALWRGCPRTALLALILVAVGLKIAHRGYYVPEWNYRHSQGPWGRAIGQWIPRKWSLYTFHDWPDDLTFFIGRSVRQFRSPRFLSYLPGAESRFVLLQRSEFDRWPAHAPPISLVSRFLDQSGQERVLARTAGLLPVPGQTEPQFVPERAW
jgi:hypothetical protein